MAKTTSKRKQTRNFLQSGQLKAQIDARHKRKAFDQKKKGRDAKRNKGVLPAHQQQQEGDDEREEREFNEVKKRRQEQQEDDDEEDEEFDVDDVLGAAGLGAKHAADGAGAGSGEDDDDEAADGGVSPALTISRGRNAPAHLCPPAGTYFA